MIRINKSGPLLLAVAMMAMTCQSFIPNGHVIISPRIETRVQDMTFFPSKSMKKSHMIRYVSDSATTEVEVPEPEKKSLLEKVRSKCLHGINTFFCATNTLVHTLLHEGPLQNLIFDYIYENIRNILVSLYIGQIDITPSK